LSRRQKSIEESAWLLKTKNPDVTPSTIIVTLDKSINPLILSFLIYKICTFTFKGYNEEKYVNCLVQLSIKKSFFPLDFNGCIKKPILDSHKNLISRKTIKHKDTG
jgi:hypothetical protein